MDKDEMKNKYSTFITEISEILGLGKPVDIIKLCATTDLFFQPLEKRIAELEQEVSEVRQHLDLTEKEWGKDLDKQIHFKTLCTKLEKENAELKETVLQFQKDSYCGVCHFKTKTQLKQAKEIIKEFVDWANWQGSNCPNFKSIQDKAEQFLSEVENV